MAIEGTNVEDWLMDDSASSSLRVRLRVKQITLYKLGNRS
jgi:hypothetical protein